MMAGRAPCPLLLGPAWPLMTYTGRVCDDDAGLGAGLSRFCCMRAPRHVHLALMSCACHAAEQ